jgi:hypothetical protein
VVVEVLEGGVEVELDQVEEEVLVVEVVLVDLVVMELLEHQTLVVEVEELVTIRYLQVLLVVLVVQVL